MADDTPDRLVSRPTSAMRSAYDRMRAKAFDPLAPVDKEADVRALEDLRATGRSYVVEIEPGMTIDVDAITKRSGSGRKSASVTNVMRYIEKSRFLAKFHPHVQQQIEIRYEWIVGDGINHKPVVPTGWSKKHKANLDRAVKEWMETTACDGARTNNIWRLDRLIQKTMDESGSCIVVHRRLSVDEMEARNTFIPLQYELYEPQMLYTGPKPREVASANGFSDGFEYNGRTGAVEAIWMWQKDPSEGFSAPIRMKLRDNQGFQQVFVLFGLTRIGAVTGLPRAISIVETAADMADYRKSMLDRMREDAKLTRWIKMGGVIGDGKSPPPVFGQGTAPQGDLSFQTPSGATMSWAAAKRIGLDLTDAVENNQVTVMPPDWELKAGQMTTTTGFPDFYKEMVRELTIAFGTPFSLGANDTKGGSFSSEKIGLIQFKKSCRSAQQYLIDMWRIPAWQAMIRNGAAIGLWPKVEVECQFIAAAFPIVDPSKEMGALKDAMNIGITSFDQACLENGRDPAEQKALLAKDIAMWKELGIPLGPGMYGQKVAVAASGVQVPDEDEEEVTPAAGSTSDE